MVDSQRIYVCNECGEGYFTKQQGDKCCTDDVLIEVTVDAEPEQHKITIFGETHTKARRKKK